MDGMLFIPIWTAFSSLEAATLPWSFPPVTRTLLKVFFRLFPRNNVPVDTVHAAAVRLLDAMVVPPVPFCLKLVLVNVLPAGLKVCADEPMNSIVPVLSGVKFV